MRNYIIIGKWYWKLIIILYPPCAPFESLKTRYNFQKMKVLIMALDTVMVIAWFGLYSIFSTIIVNQILKAIDSDHVTQILCLNLLQSAEENKRKYFLWFQRSRWYKEIPNIVIKEHIERCLFEQLAPSFEGQLLVERIKSYCWSVF